MTAFDDVLRLYDYDFPDTLIAQAPASPRDSAKLLVYDRESHVKTDAMFHDIGSFLPKNAVLVLNDTKVIPARLVLTRATGGQVSVLLLGPVGDSIRTMANRKLHEGEFLQMEGERGFDVIQSDGKYWILRPTFPMHELNDTLNRHGSMPLPPYIKHSPLTEEELRREYQSVFAEHSGSIAAPTASLHFTPELLESLQQSGIQIVKVTLHVHLGTFAPLTEEQLRSGKLHTEEYVIDAHAQHAQHALMQAKSENRPIIAVGTTAVRTLESSADEDGHIVRPKGSTDLFIREGYTFRLTTGLITNFHVPKSSLIMLVAALVGREKLLELYRQAIEKNYRLFSFGDAMLIL